MSDLPPRARLVRVATSLGRHLPAALPGLLDAARFDAERPALARLADPDHARAAAAAMSEAEAAWMAELLLARWAAVGAVTLEPAAAIVAPAQVWLGAAPVTIPVGVAVDGLEPGWRCHWHVEGALEIEPDPHAPALSLRVRRPATGSPADLALRVSVQGRLGDARVLLVDQAPLRLRTPLLVISDDRRQILVRDQHERPAAQARVRCGEVDLVTDGRGVVHLDEPAPAGAEVRVEGVLAGRVPPGAVNG